MERLTSISLLISATNLNLAEACFSVSIRSESRADLAFLYENRVVEKFEGRRERRVDLPYFILAQSLFRKSG
jgi:hypothetical protein